MTKIIRHSNHVKAYEIQIFSANDAKLQSKISKVNKTVTSSSRKQQRGIADLRGRGWWRNGCWQVGKSFDCRCPWHYTDSYKNSPS